MRYVAVIFVFCVGVAIGWLSRPHLNQLYVSAEQNNAQLKAQKNTAHENIGSNVADKKPLVHEQTKIKSVDDQVLHYLVRKQFLPLKQFLVEQPYSIQQEVKSTIFVYLKEYEPDNQQLENLYLDIYGKEGLWAMWKTEESLRAKKNLLNSAQLGWMALNSGDLTPEMELKLEQVLEQVMFEALNEQLQKEPLNQSSLMQLRILFEGLVSFRAANEHFQFGYASLLVTLGELVTAKYYLNALRYSETYGGQARELLSFVALSEQGGSQVNLEQYGDHYLLPFFVGGSLQAKLLLDTGASMTVITPSVLASLPKNLYKLVEKSVPFNTANGRVSGDIYTLSQVQVLGYKLDNVNVAVLPLSSPEYQGLLGMNILNLFEFDLNQRRGELRLQPKK